jgi:hypothetical protein
MAFDTRKAALADLGNFTPELRARVKIVRFWSPTFGRWRYCHVLSPRPPV